MNASVLNHLFQEELYRFSTPVIVVLPRAWDAYAPEEQLLLNKILTSVKLSINAVRILAGPTVGLKSLTNYQPSKVLIFGDQPGEPAQKYETTAAQGFTVIRADDLNAMDDQKKKSLWIALRQMFVI